MLFFKFIPFILAIAFMSGCVSSPSSAPHPRAPQTYAPTLPDNLQTRRALAKCDALYSTRNNNHIVVQNCKNNIFTSKSLSIREATSAARIDTAYRRMTIGELNATSRRNLDTQRANARTYEDYARGTRSWIKTVKEFKDLFNGNKRSPYHYW